MAQDHAITTDPARIFLLALKEMFPRLSPVSLANVFYLNSPTGAHNLVCGPHAFVLYAYAHRTHGSKGDMASRYVDARRSDNLIECER